MIAMPRTPAELFDFAAAKAKAERDAIVEFIDCPLCPARAYLRSRDEHDGSKEFMCRCGFQTWLPETPKAS